MSTAAQQVSAMQAPTMREVSGLADQLIVSAALALWPGARLQGAAHVPSVTSYIRRLVVNDTVVYAKSILGMPLVELLRGAAGSWPATQEAQRVYLRDHGSFLEREAGQLAVLHRGRHPQVARLMGYHDGVLFTQAVPGLPLSEMLLHSPQDTALLLAGVMGGLDGLHRQATSRLVIGSSIEERGIASAFQRKFASPSAAGYMASLVTAWPAETMVLRAAVDRLRASDLRGGGLTTMTSRVVYGYLTPEHVLYPGSPGAEPVYLTPGLMRDTPLADPARLLSRSVLTLLAARPGRAVAESVAQGLAAFCHQQAARFPGVQGQALRALLRLWAMDTLTIMSTYLAAPADLPLPGHATALLPRAGCALDIAHQVAAAVSAHRAPEPALLSALAAVVEAAS